MKHFTDEAWLDFVRRLKPPAEMAAMQQHLDEGCRRCHSLRTIWQTVAEVASRELRYASPENVLRSIHAAYAQWRQVHLIPQSARLTRLVFDSFRTPLPAGVRTHALATRRLLQRAGPWTIDMRLESEARNRISLAGQVLRSGKKPAETTTMQILLVREDELVTQTTTNEFGEFQVQFDKAPGLRIYIEVPGKRALAIQLPDSDEHSPPDIATGEPRES